MHIGEKGLALIMRLEGFRPQPYNCPANDCTIGYGHKIHDGPCTIDDMADWPALTAEAARNLLMIDVAPREAVVSNAVDVPLNQNQFDALVSFVYNVGGTAFSASTLLRKLNAGKYEEVPAQMNRWVYIPGGKVLPGLVDRRKAECQLFQEPMEAANG